MDRVVGGGRYYSYVAIDEPRKVESVSRERSRAVAKVKMMGGWLKEAT